MGASPKVSVVSWQRVLGREQADRHIKVSSQQQPFPSLGEGAKKVYNPTEVEKYPETSHET